MTKMETLSAVIILSAAVATPVFAQDAGVLRPGSHSGSKPQPVTNHRPDFREGYNALNGSLSATPRTQDNWNRENVGFGGSDPSRVGGQDPSFHPPS
jgi:hypothetical protein